MKVMIGASVGRGGENRPEDVGQIQSLLNATGLNPPLEVTCEAGSETIKAITEFQYRHTLEPDGRIDPEGPTLRALNRAYKVGDMPVPDHTLVKLLGYGAFGEVWMAQTSSGVKKALKLIPLDRGSGWKEFKGVFRVRDIRNPCLVSITDVWLLDTEGKVLGREDVDQLIKDASSSLFGRGTIAIPLTKPKVLVVAMQLCEQSLYNVLEGSGGKGIPKDKLLRFMEDAARGLDYLNSRQHQFSFSGSRDRDSNEMVAIRHCDVKPENIMVVGGCAQVCDFGLAQIARAGGVRKRTGQLHASIYYAAPEMLEEDGVPTETTDQYSLALTYYHLRTGDLPFRQEDRNSLPALLDAHTRGRLDLSKLPERERKVIQKATSLNPKKRFKTCGEMVKELKGVRTGPWWRDRGVAAAAAAILLSAVVGLGLLVQDRLLGPRKRLAAAIASFNTAAIACENLDTLAENYTNILQEHETLRTFGFIRDDVAASRRNVLAKILANTEVWLNESHEECPAATSTVTTLLDNLVRHYTRETPDLRWDARFLQARQRVQQRAAAGEQLEWLRKQHEKLSSPESGNSRSAEAKLLLLDGLELATLDLPVEESPEALTEAFDRLERIDALRRRAAEQSAVHSASSTRQPWAWSRSWESNQLADMQRTLYDYLAGYESWWAQDRLTEERERLVRSLWGANAEKLLPDVKDKLQMHLINAADARQNGNHGTALGHLANARATVSSSSDDGGAAANRIAAEELRIWVSFPDIFRQELLRELTQGPPSLRHFEACETLREEGKPKSQNPLVRALWAESRLYAGKQWQPSPDGTLPEPAVFVAEGLAEADAAWYTPFVHYVAALATAEAGDHAAAVTHAMRAFEATTATVGEGTALVAAPFRRARGSQILLAAVRPEVQSDEAFDAQHLFRPENDWFTEPLERLQVARTLHSDVEADAYHTVAAFARAHRTRDSVKPADWRKLADEAARVLAASDAPEGFRGQLHLVAADARTRSIPALSSEANERLLEIVEHYASAVGRLIASDLAAVEAVDPDYARVVYDEIVAPAAQVADALYTRRGQAPAKKNPTDKERAMALVYRLQGYLLRRHPPLAGDADAAPRDVAVEAFIALDKSNEFELNADALHEEAVILADLADPPASRAADRVEKLSSIASQILECAITNEQRALGHHIRAFALIAYGREQDHAGRDKSFEAAIAAFDEAEKLVPKATPTRAMILEGRSTARVERAVSARPDRAVWQEWLNLAARDAESASGIDGRRNEENAFNAWGNALEDLAYYCRVSMVENYAAALAKFQEARRLGREKGLVYEKPYLYSLVSAARCRLRRLREAALPPGADRADELDKATKELAEALFWLEKLPASDRQSLARKAEVLYWQGMIHYLQPDQQLQEVAKRWVATTELVRETPDWPYRQLDLIQLYAEAGESALVVEKAHEMLNAARAERVEPRLIKEATMLLLNHVGRPFDLDLSQLFGRIVGELPAADRSELFAEKCLLSYNKNREDVLRDDFQRYARDLTEAKQGLPAEVSATAAKELPDEMLRALAKVATAEGAMQGRRAIGVVQTYLTDRPERATPDLTSAEADLTRALGYWRIVESRLPDGNAAERESILLETQNPRYYLIDVYIALATVDAVIKPASDKPEARKKHDQKVTDLLTPLLVNPRTSKQARANQASWDTILTRLLPAK